MADINKNMKIVVGADASNAIQGFNTLETKIGALKGLFAGFLATATIGGLVNFFTSATRAAAEEEDGLKKLERQLERVGVSYASVSQSVVSLSKDIQNKTRFADDEAIAALNTLIQKTGDYDFAVANLSLVTDIAAARGTDLISVADKLGLAYNGVTRGLREYGVAAKDTDRYLEVLNERYAGEAARDLESYGGKLRQVHNLWEEFKETAGGELLPVLTDVTAAMKEWLQDEQNIENLRAIAELVGSIAKGLIAAAPYLAALKGPGGASLVVANSLYPKTPFSNVPLNDFGGAAGVFGPDQHRAGKGISEAVEKVKELKLLTTGELMGNIRELESLLLSSKDPVVLSQAVKKLTEMRDLLRGFSNDKAFQSLAESMGVGAKDIPDISGMEANPRDAVDNYWKNQFSKNMEAIRGKMDAEFAKSMAQFNRILNLSAMVGIAFQSNLATVFGSIRSMADLAAFSIKDVFQALGDAILDILSQIAAKMAAIGLLNLIGGFFGIPGLGGVLGPIIPSGGGGAGGGTRSFHGGSGMPPIGGSTFGGAQLQPVHNYNFYVQGSVVTERELFEKNREYLRKMDRYGQ